MRAFRIWCGVTLLCAGTASAEDHGFMAVPASTPAVVRGLALEAQGGDVLLARAAREERPDADAGRQIFTSERARALFRSLTVPGWGQLALGRKTSGGVFALVEAGIWTSFTAFKVQEKMRSDSYERSARILAGIDLSGRDEEYRRVVGSYLSSDDYNLYVVYRDAANIFLSDPDNSDPAAYRQYIADHSLGAADAWAWGSVEDLLRYRQQRKDAQRAGIRANNALAVAILNRLVSALHAARAASLDPAAPETGNSIRLEVVPFDFAHAGAFRMGLRYSF